MKKAILLITAAMLIFTAGCQRKARETMATGKRWSPEQAQQWADEQGWLRGSNFNPSTAINQLETWQAESFDTTTINRELGWASAIGLSTAKVSNNFR
jgi:hypothetical protein